jgi:hypothetical protein
MVVKSLKNCREEFEELSSFFKFSGIATWRVEMPHNRNSQHVKSRNVEIRNAKMIKSSLAKLFFSEFQRS